MTRSRRITTGVLLVAGGVLAGSRYLRANGATVILLATLAPALVLGGARVLVSRPRLGGVLDAALLMVVSLGVLLLALELGLGWLVGAKQDPGALGSQADGLVIPDAWKDRPVQVPGAIRANYWHGKLHVYNQDGFRAAGDYLRDDGRRRIVVLGDSLTYGAGIAAEDTYAAVLESLWQKSDATVRVYNLGVPGNQSEDILRVAKKWFPILKPDRVIYGICLNDFLPSGVGQYTNYTAWQIPLPEKVTKPFETRTRLGAIFAARYNRALMRLGIRNDFFSDILEEFGSYQTRFKRDLAELNRLVKNETGKSAVALVLNQYPSDERGRRIAGIAEAAAAEAGMDVVPTGVYYERFRDGKTQLHVSKWEGHPNEMVNRIYAEMLARRMGVPVRAAASGSPAQGAE